MPHYHVFLGAPTTAQLECRETYKWHTVSYDDNIDNGHSSQAFSSPDSAQTNSNERVDVITGNEGDEERDRIIPSATLEAVQQRVEDMYKHVIFHDEDEIQEGNDLESEASISSSHNEITGDEYSLIPWPPSNPAFNRLYSRSSQTQSASRTHNNLYTQDTTSASLSFADTSASSIAAFPAFVINLHTLTSLSELLSSLSKPREAQTVSNPSIASSAQKVCILAAVLDVDGPDVVTLRQGRDAGKEVSVLRFVVGDERGGIGRLVAWRECAEKWAGLDVSIDEGERIQHPDHVRRGDIVYLENILASSTSITGDKHRQPSVPTSDILLSLTASPALSSFLHICYRTMPMRSTDARLRPDLRLAASDAGVRRVAAVARWFEEAVGIND